MKPLMKIAPVLGAALLMHASPCLAGDNAAFGTAAGVDMTTGTDNTILGTLAGESVTTGTDNTLVGYKGGKGVTGNYNIILGEDPSSAITSGGSNILVGNSLTKVTNSSSSQLDIGDTLYGTLGGSGTITAANNFTVLGTIIGNLFSGSGASLTSLNGSNISSGTVAAARLPTGTVITTTASPAQGDILYYNGSNWVDLTAGTNGYFLETQGASANPIWAVAGNGTVNSGTQYDLGYYAATGTAISGSSAITTDSGGDLTSTGTITGNLFSGSGASLTNLDGSNISSGTVSAARLPAGTVITTTGSPAQGDILYYNGSNWVDLAAGTDGYFLETQGASANPTWAVAGNGTVNSGTQYQIGYYASTGTTISGDSSIVTDSSGDLSLGSGSYQLNANTVLTFPDADPTSIAVGTSALTSQSSTSLNNTAVGDTALDAMTNGTDSTAVGSAALYSATGSPNTAVGYETGYYITSGSDNIAIGYDAMVGTSAHPLTGANAGNVAIGDNALTAITGAAAGNIAVGYNALTSSTVSSTNPNTAIGDEALEYATTGTNNTAIGNLAMTGTSAHPLTGAGGNVAVGDSALTAISGTAAGSTAVGYNAMSVATGSPNTALGYESGDALTTGTDNTLVGYKSGLGVTGSHNIILGEDPSSAITTGSSNILVGNSLMEVTNTSSGQLDIGDTLYGTLGGSGTITAANNFTAVGTITGNLFSGSGASLTSLDGSNISSGTVGAAYLPAGTVITSTASPAQGDVLYYNGSNWVDLAAGTAGQFLETQGGSANPKWATGVGSGTINSGTQYQLGYYASTGTAMSGDSHLTTDSSNDLNIVSSSAALEIGSNNILNLPDSSTTNIAVGYQALLNDTTATANTALGDGAMHGTSATPMTTTADNNTALGYNAMYSLQGSNPTDNVAVGNAAAYYMSTAAYNTAVGSYAMEGVSASLLTGYYNVAVGYEAMVNLQGTAEHNTALGASAGNDITTGTNDTVIGYQAGNDITTGTDNTLVGYQAGIAVTGSHNVMVGEDPSHAITSGSSNILVGNSLTKATSTSSNQVDIGDVIVVTGTGTPSTSATTIEGDLTVEGNLNIPTGAFQLDGNTVLTIPDSSTSNIAVGYQALLNDTTATNNTALGASAMHGTSATPMTTSADNNTAVGYTAMYNLQGSNPLGNTAVGNAAAYYMSTAAYNTVVGSNAMQGISATPLTGYYNTAVGYAAMNVLQGAAAYNTALGASAGNGISTGTNNTMIGWEAGYDTSTGTDNTLLGYAAGIAVTGNYNIMVGEDPSHAITSGSSNILIGNSLTKVSAGTDNQIDIGDVIVVTGAGTPSTSSTTIEGTLTVDGGVTLSGIASSTTGDYVCANGSTIGKGTTCTLSDENAKQDIVPLTDALAEVEQFQPVQFRYKDGFGYDATTLHVGFTAQRMAKVDPRVVVYDKGSPHAVVYENITAINSAAIQEQQKEIDELKAELKTLREQQAK